MIKALIINAAVITACGTTAPDPAWVDPKLKPLLADWAAICKQHLDPSRCNADGLASIELRDKLSEENTVGTCQIKHKLFEETRSVYIRSDIPLDGYYAKAVFLHEMLHCRMRYETHTDSGIMAAVLMFNEEGLKEDWEMLVDEAYSLVK